jgi:hypothetical protein
MPLPVAGVNLGRTLGHKRVATRLVTNLIGFYSMSPLSGLGVVLSRCCRLCLGVVLCPDHVKGPMLSGYTQPSARGRQILGMCFNSGCEPLSVGVDTRQAFVHPSGTETQFSEPPIKEP